MNTYHILNKLIALTGQRDIVALELALAESLHDLIAPQCEKSDQYVLLYRALNLREQEFSSVGFGAEAIHNRQSGELKYALTQAFKTGEYSAYKQQGESNIALYPLKDIAGQTTAVIAFNGLVCASDLHETVMMLIQICQNFTGLIYDNERDTLTGLLNRKTFENKISQSLVQIHKTYCRKNDKPNQLHFLAIFDIDHFKKVNDVFGHLIGDEVLLLFSQLMSQSFRSTDALFRFGGEEFVCLFECSSHDDIALILNRFKEKISQFEFPQVGKVTASAGYTEISANDISTELIGRADQALYYAKHNGRNRICYYEQLIAEQLLQATKKESDIELF